jgi:hypothetical protein
MTSHVLNGLNMLNGLNAVPCNEAIDVSPSLKCLIARFVTVILSQVRYFFCAIFFLDDHSRTLLYVLFKNLIASSSLRVILLSPASRS